MGFSGEGLRFRDYGSGIVVKGLVFMGSNFEFGA